MANDYEEDSGGMDAAAYREAQYNCTHPESWIWSEERLSWVAPVDPPQDGLPYIWDEELKQWVSFPGYPTEPNNEDQ